MIDISLPIVVYTLAVVFFSAIIRGLSGFGFSMLTVMLLGMVAPVSQVVPIILILEVFASSSLLPSVWKVIDWKVLRALLIGLMIGTPIGMSALVNVPQAPMIIAINSVIFVGTVLLLMGYSAKKDLSTPTTVGTGFISGILNGASANGGLPLILFFLSSPKAIATGRATMIAYFGLADIWATMFTVYEGLVSLNTLIISVACLIPLFLGIFVGNKLFVYLDEAKAKRISIIFVLCISIVGLTKELIKFIW